MSPLLFNCRAWKFRKNKSKSLLHFPQFVPEDTCPGSGILRNNNTLLTISTLLLRLRAAVTSGVYTTTRETPGNVPRCRTSSLQRGTRGAVGMMMGLTFRECGLTTSVWETIKVINKSISRNDKGRKLGKLVGSKHSQTCCLKMTIMSGGNKDFDTEEEMKRATCRSNFIQWRRSAVIGCLSQWPTWRHLLTPSWQHLSYDVLWWDIISWSI